MQYNTCMISLEVNSHINSVYLSSFVTTELKCQKEVWNKQWQFEATGHILYALYHGQPCCLIHCVHVNEEMCALVDSIVSFHTKTQLANEVLAKE